MTYKYQVKNVSCIEVVNMMTGSKDLSKPMVDELYEVYRKAKAFDTFLKYNQHVEKYNNSDCHELERVFQGVIKEYEEDK